MRLGWGYLEILGGIVTMLGALAIVQGCPFAYGPCTFSTTVGETGFVTAIAGSILTTIAEFKRRKSSAKPLSIE